MDLSAIALQGVQQAEVQLERAATRIASYGATNDPAAVDTVDLSAEVVALMSARNEMALNLKTLQVAGEIQQHTLDIFA